MTKAMQYINENFLSENFTLKEQEEFLNITKKIIMHEEFEKRCTEEFYHHGSTTLGEHIIKDTILTYRMIKIYKLKHPLKKNKPRRCLTNLIISRFIYQSLAKQRGQKINNKSRKPRIYTSCRSSYKLLHLVPRIL